MKKICLFMTMALAMVISFSSCKKTVSEEDAKAVAEKINNGQDLTEDDYLLMGDYLIGAYDGAEAELEKGNNIDEVVNSVNEKYSYADMFYYAINDYTGDSKSVKDAIDKIKDRKNQFLDKVAEFKDKSMRR